MIKYDILFYLLFITFNICYGTLSDRLSYYETLNRADVIHHSLSKRSIDLQSYIKHINFHSHGEKFRLNLIPSQEIFSSSFEAIVINSKQEKRKVPINRKSFYHGYDELHPSSDVIAHVEDDGMIDAKISTLHDTYFIEPMWRHDHPTHDMIIYKASNVNSSLINNHQNHSFCSAAGNHNNNISFSIDDDVSSNRERRSSNDFAVTSKNTCELILIADYTYYKHVGGSNEQTCIHTMLQIISRVDRIYRRTYWRDVGTNIGVQVKHIIVYESPSENQPSFNQDRGNWNEDALLHEFAYGNWENYCLAHLFTYRDFGKTLGLAYIAAPNVYAGICAKSYYGVGGKRHENCGLTTNVEGGKRLLNIEADLVTAHELGHNFGSNHDENDKCSPSFTNGGKFLMYPKAVKGDYLNNFKFSECSNQEISHMLKLKRLDCFKDQSVGRCGNSIVETGEECDAGFFDDGDVCCDRNCKFRNESFQCSDANDDCCINCMVASTNLVCRSMSQILCRQATFCNGVSKTCPSLSPPLSGNTCGFSKGKCVQGQCKPLCELEQPIKYRCQCSSPNQCKVCCRSSNTSDCIALSEEKLYIDENDGIPCEFNNEPGECLGGHCRKIVKNVEDEFSSLLDDFSFSKFGRFLASNIVGTILFFSVPVWIILSRIIHLIDKGKIKLPNVVTSHKTRIKCPCT